MAPGFNACSSDDSQSFVRVKGEQFILNGNPYYYFGANFWHGAYLAADLVKGDRDRLLKELDQLAEYKITNLRIMAASEESALEMSVKPAFQTAPRVYNEELLKGLDFLMAELAKRNMKAVLVLNNYWQWSGGMSQYINWVTGEEIIDPDKTGDWDGFQEQSAKFYINDEANAIYRDYIRMLVNRKNTVTGVVYKNDSNIMAWQLGNEPRPAPDAAENPINRKAFIDWVYSTSDYIKSLDPNHLVSTGNEGTMGSRFDMSIYSEAHQCPNIDYLTFHIWPKNWGWYKVHDTSSFEPSLQNTLDYFAEHVEKAAELNKPTVLEEFGLERDGGSFSPDTTTAYRDRYLDALFSKVVEKAKDGSPMAGLNFWAWGGMARTQSAGFIWKPGDSFMGDPPQEPQGLNSVFSSDTSTLKIFEKYNTQLDALIKP